MPLASGWTSIAILAATVGLAADEPPSIAFESTPGPERTRIGRLDPLFRRIDPARFQTVVDRWLGLDAGEVSDRPEAPEIGEPLFFDAVRPLGALKGGNELNYLYQTNSRSAPPLQVIEYEYVIADWRSIEFDLSYFAGRLEILTPFYQRTLGVGPRGNWVHGYQVSADIYQRAGFLGGTAVYAFAWEPEKDDPFGTVIFLGANRALIGGFNAVSGRNTIRTPGTDRVFGAWRPTINVNFFYQIDDRLTVGIENDLFCGPGRAGEYLILPLLTYKPGPHLILRAGAGYYRYEARDQFTFLVHVNLVNPSRRRSRESAEEPTRPEARSPGLFRRLLDRG